jgi:hypothetical protein
VRDRMRKAELLRQQQEGEGDAGDGSVHGCDTGSEGWAGKAAGNYSKADGHATRFNAGASVLAQAMLG